jgi:hypothetical protein
LNLLAAGTALSAATARNHVGLVVEPQPAVLFQHPIRRLDVATVAYDFGQSLILDLGDIDRGVPRCEQRRGSYRAADLVRQSVHMVTKDRVRVGRGVEIVVPRCTAEFPLDLSQNCMTIGRERILARPDAVYDFQARSSPWEWMPIRRPPGRRECTNGATTFEALNSTLARAR